MRIPAPHRNLTLLGLISFKHCCSLCGILDRQNAGCPATCAWCGNTTLALNQGWEGTNLRTTTRIFLFIEHKHFTSLASFSLPISIPSHPESSPSPLRSIRSPKTLNESNYGNQTCLQDHTRSSASFSTATVHAHTAPLRSDRSTYTWHVRQVDVLEHRLQETELKFGGHSHSPQQPGG